MPHPGGGGPSRWRVSRSLTVAIAGSWADAKAGTLVNLVILATAVIAAAIDGPWGLRAEYDRDVRAALARARAHRRC